MLTRAHAAAFGLGFLDHRLFSCSVGAAADFPGLAGGSGVLVLRMWKHV